MAARSAKQKAALRKAQLASARKRRGRGKGRVSAKSRLRTAGAKSQIKRRSTAAKKSTVKRRSTSAARVKNRRRTVARAGMVGAVAAVAAGGAVVYRNRENLIIKHVAVRRAVKDHKANAARLGRKLDDWEVQWVKEQEKLDHANRSVFRVREYIEARSKARAKFARGRSLRPDRSVNAWSAGMGVTGVPTAKQRYYFESYRKDVHSRALARHARMTGKKRKFGYNSGKRLLVNQKGKVKRTFW